MHDGKIFPRFNVKVKATWAESFEIWPHARSIGQERIGETNGSFDIMSPQYLLRTERAEFMISSQGLSHVTLNLGFLPESAKCRVHILEHGLSNADETWYVARGQ